MRGKVTVVGSIYLERHVHIMSSKALQLTKRIPNSSVDVEKGKNRSPRIPSKNCPAQQHRLKSMSMQCDPTFVVRNPSLFLLKEHI